jgi:ERCC4-type nuclease
MNSLTDREIANILADITIIIDSREQKNQHIINYFKDNDIPYIVDKLHIADYSFYLPNYSHLGLDRKFVVEKKNSLDEISGNFTKDRDRFAREFERITDEKIHLVVETATWKRLLSGSYRSKLAPRSFMASMLTWNIRYKCPIWFVGLDESPTLIYNILYYEVFEYLKGVNKDNGSQ